MNFVIYAYDMLLLFLPSLYLSVAQLCMLHIIDSCDDVCASIIDDEEVEPLTIVFYTGTDRQGVSLSSCDSIPVTNLDTEFGIASESHEAAIANKTQPARSIAGYVELSCT